MVSTTYLPLVRAVQDVTGYRPNLSTVCRWATIGARGQMLQTVMIGGRRLTTLDWVREFVDAGTTATTPRAKQAKHSEAMATAKTELATMLDRKKKPSKVSA